MNKPEISKESPPLWIKIVAVITTLFGLATIKEGGTVLFTEEGRIAAGHFVPFVLWFNFIAGFAYVVASIALFKLKSCAKRLSAVIAITTSITFIFFGIHILNGGEYEMRTIAAMTIRSTLWISITVALFRSNAMRAINCKC